MFRRKTIRKAKAYETAILNEAVSQQGISQLYSDKYFIFTFKWKALLLTTFCNTDLKFLTRPLPYGILLPVIRSESTDVSDGPPFLTSSNKPSKEQAGSKQVLLPSRVMFLCFLDLLVIYYIS
jgi:hypothetical protein